MNIHLLNVMARTTDNSKIETVKSTLIDIIVKDGSNHASIAKMAQKAGVSSGYLYRHYDSKDSLIEALYTEKFNEINEILLEEIDKSQSLYDAIYAFYTTIVNLAKSNQNQILFFLKIMTEYAMKITTLTQSGIATTVEIFRNKFKSELNPQCSLEQIFIQILGTILLFINMRKRGLFSDSVITDEEIVTLTQMSLNALK